MPINYSAFKLGQDSANTILSGWIDSNYCSRQKIKEHIRQVLSLALDSINKHEKIWDFTIGYFQAIKNINDPELNKVIEP